MTWEYLPKLDERVKFIADYLDGKTKGKIIVDLNCLEARLLKYIYPDFKRYIGNDVIDKFPGEYKNTSFYQREDYKFVQNDVKGCDILVVMGFAMSWFENQPVESNTLAWSVGYLTGKYDPEIIIVECIQDFTPMVRKALGIDFNIQEKLNLGSDRIERREVLIHGK